MICLQVQFGWMKVSVRFPFPVRLETAPKTVFDMSSDEFEIACREAVTHREDVVTMDYVTRFDQESGLITKVYEDGRVE